MVNRPVVRSRERIERDYFLSQIGDVREVGPVTEVTPAGSSVVEIPYFGRTRGAVQIYTEDGSAFVASFKIQGTLRGGEMTKADSGYPAFLNVSDDDDYIDITAQGATATLTGPGIYQLPVNFTFSRIRIICTAYTSGNPRIRVV